MCQAPFPSAGCQASLPPAQRPLHRSPIPQRTTCKLRAAETLPAWLDRDALYGLDAAVGLTQHPGDDGGADLGGGGGGGTPV